MRGGGGGRPPAHGCPAPGGTRAPADPGQRPWQYSLASGLWEKETLRGESRRVEGAEGPRGSGVQAGLTLPGDTGGLRGRQGGCHFLVAIMKLFSMQRTMKACWQLLAACSSSFPEAREDAWPVTARSSVRHVSQ